MIKTITRRFFPMTVATALEGLSMAQANLLKAAHEADRLAEAHERLVEYHQDVVDVAKSESDRAKRVSERLDDLLA